MTRTAPVAVVIPAHNAAQYLPLALDSLRQQTTVPAEVVVVDDGSRDDTAAVAERLGATVLRQDQAGPGAARNRGLRRATAEFVAFLDADDWFALSKLERSVATLQRLGARCVATDAWLVRGDRVEHRKNERRFVPEVVTMERLLRGNPIICSTVMCRRTELLEVGGFDEAPDLLASEDYDLWLRLAAREPIAYLAEPLSFYRVHQGSLSANTRFLRGVDRILDKVVAQHPGEAHFLELVQRRRAELRLDVAYDRLRAGARQEARTLIDEAQHQARTWKGYRMWLRTLLPF
ncbi:MAG: glycosyltransferase family 2 protein [Planctomycetes bacterium]|nr:glycosyltransferase family 2 protein [Planctomycetota bacterium]